MDHFDYRDESLFCEDVPLGDVAEAVGTPAYVYSKATLLHHYRAFAEAFAELSPTICFSIKSLANLSILRLLAAEGSSFDVTSGGELARAVEAAHGDVSKVVFAGVGKTDVEITAAIEAGIGLFNVESEAEFENLSLLSHRSGRRTRAALRLNPDVYDPQTHTYTATGRKESKFGVDIERAILFFERYGHDENVLLDGIHIHIGSPIYSPKPYVEAIGKTLDVIARLRAGGFEIRTLDIGGFAADYEAGKSPPAKDYAGRIVPLLRDTGLDVIIEPGRHISCNAGVLLTRVQYVKRGGDRQFVIVDASMADLIRPALYGGEHVIAPVRLGPGQPAPRRFLDYRPPGGVKVDIVGGVCESSDFLGKDRFLQPTSRGDLLVVHSAGAYGFVMASQYNTRPRAAEVLVDGASYRIIRPRETYDELLAAERECIE